VNKANYFVTRKISREVSFSPEGLSSKVVIIYDNTSPANVSFGGVYKNYLRVLTALGSTLEKISIDDRQLNLTSEIDREISYEKSSTGFLVEVPPGAQKKIEIIYKIPIDSSGNEFVYQLFVQKQPGTEQDAFSLQILSPWQTSETNFPTVVKNGNISYNGDLLVDRLFIIKFKK